MHKIFECVCVTTTQWIDLFDLDGIWVLLAYCAFFLFTRRHRSLIFRIIRLAWSYIDDGEKEPNRLEYLSQIQIEKLVSALYRMRSLEISKIPKCKSIELTWMFVGQNYFRISVDFNWLHCDRFSRSHSPPEKSICFMALVMRFQLRYSYPHKTLPWHNTLFFSSFV